jgi:enoyl-CoA hydratase/carnithine racemase
MSANAVSKARTDAPLLLRHMADGILTLTLNKPAARNSLSSAMMSALGDALDAARDDGETRVIVIAGARPAFCAGHDLRELDSGKSQPDGGRAMFTALMQQCARLMQSIVNHPRPVIADVRGVASAAGCQLAASCDLVVASSEARFATPGVNIGLFCSTPMVALSRKVSQKHAMEMLLTGEAISARRAHEIGLVNRVHAPEEMDEAVRGLAGRIASKSLMSLATGKEAFYRQVDMALPDAYAYTADVMIENMLKHDAREGVAAFIEKRAPQWRDE